MKAGGEDVAFRRYAFIRCVSAAASSIAQEEAHSVRQHDPQKRIEITIAAKAPPSDPAFLEVAAKRIDSVCQGRGGGVVGLESGVAQMIEKEPPAATSPEPSGRWAKFLAWLSGGKKKKLPLPPMVAASAASRPASQPATQPAAVQVHHVKRDPSEPVRHLGRW